MKHFFRSVFTLGLMILCFARCADAQAQAPSKTPAKARPQSTAKTPAQTPAKSASAKEAAAKPAPLEVPQLKFEKYKLENGLDVILSEDHRLPLVAVNLWYHVGPANELPGRTGFAHLFEHMMFEGSKHVASSAHNRYLEAA